MLATVHLVAGVAIAKATGNIFLAVPAAFVSHYILDSIPHYAWAPIKSFRRNGLEKKNFLQILREGLESIFGIALTLYLISRFPEQTLLVTLTAFISWVPDLLVFLEWEYKIKRPWPIRNFEIAFHRHTKSKLNLLFQLLVTLVLVIYILN